MGRFVRSKAVATLLGVHGALGCSSAPDTLAVPAPDDVPIQLATDANLNPVRMYVDVQLGSAPPFKALLDTGSSGLRILEGTVPDSTFASITTTAVTYAYGNYESTIAINGVVAFTNVTIDKLTTANPIPVMLVQGSGCTQSSSCRTLQDEFSDAPAKLGVGTEANAKSYGIGNPIAQLPGHPSFVIHVSTDYTSPAFMRIGQLPTDALAFKTFRLGTLSGGVPLSDGTPVWNDFSIPTCIDDQTMGTSYCLPSPWDTGDPTSYVSWPEQPVSYTTELPVGSAVNVTIGPSNAPMGAYQFVVGASPAPGVDELRRTAGGSGIHQPRSGIVSPLRCSFRSGAWDRGTGTTLNTGRSVMVRFAAMCVATLLTATTASAQQRDEAAPTPATAPPAAAIPAPSPSPTITATPPDIESDHDNLVHHLAVGYFGASLLPIAVPPAGPGSPPTGGTVTAPAIGARYWFSRRFGLDAGFGIGFNQGSQTVNSAST